MRPIQILFSNPYPSFYIRANFKIVFFIFYTFQTFIQLLFPFFQFMPSFIQPSLISI